MFRLESKKKKKKKKKKYYICYLLMCLNCVGWVVNLSDPNHPARSVASDLTITVCSGLSVGMIRLNTVPCFLTDVRGLRDLLQVELLQDQAQIMLSDYIFSNCPASKVRFGKLLLSLPTLRTVSPRAVEEIFFRRTIGDIPIERLLCDMFKSS